MLSPAKKKYLFSIYEIGLHKAIIRSVDIAKAIQISKASVCNMLVTLADDGLIEKDSERIIALTDKGEQIAKTLYEGYTVMNRFFCTKLKSPQDSAREDAIACVCNITDKNAENMKKYFMDTI